MKYLKNKQMGVTLAFILLFSLIFVIAQDSQNNLDNGGGQENNQNLEDLNENKEGEVKEDTSYKFGNQKVDLKEGDNIKEVGEQNANIQTDNIQKPTTLEDKDGNEGDSKKDSEKSITYEGKNGEESNLPNGNKLDSESKIDAENGEFKSNKEGTKINDGIKIKGKNALGEDDKVKMSFEDGNKNGEEGEEDHGNEENSVEITKNEDGETEIELDTGEKGEKTEIDDLTFNKDDNGREEIRKEIVDNEEGQTSNEGYEIAYKDPTKNLGGIPDPIVKNDGEGNTKLFSTLENNARVEHDDSLYPNLDKIKINFKGSNINSREDFANKLLLERGILERANEAARDFNERWLGLDSEKDSNFNYKISLNERKGGGVNYDNTYKKGVNGAMISYPKGTSEAKLSAGVNYYATKFRLHDNYQNLDPWVYNAIPSTYHREEGGNVQDTIVPSLDKYVESGNFPSLKNVMTGKLFSGEGDGFRAAASLTEFLTTPVYGNEKTFLQFAIRGSRDGWPQALHDVYQIGDPSNTQNPDNAYNDLQNRWETWLKSGKKRDTLGSTEFPSNKK